MKAQRIFYDKALLPDGSIVEMVIWQLPKSSSERPHGLKYRLYYGKDNERVVGYDNERGKGDHKHIYNTEKRYRFTTVEKLIADFLADIEKVKNAQSK
ncbi:MAG: hypothetical protein EBS66_18590 [Betaproteobacteria bacterium]|nr:hypothetical protein [Betaproteobacteria bacterium]